VNARSGSIRIRCSALLLALFLSSCALLPDDEAAWVLEDLAAGERASRLKRVAPDPARRGVQYRVRGKHYQGDLFLPGETPRAGMVLVPGIAEQGKDDPRLVAFANTLARAGFLVLVPDLPNLRALRVEAEDARQVAGAFSHLLSRPEFPSGRRGGMVAFSYAVGPAVLAALDPAIGRRVDFVLGVGGYHDLHRVITFFTTGYYQKEGRWHYLRPNRYGKWVFVLTNLDRLRHAVDRIALRTIAERKLSDPDAEVDDLRWQLTPDGEAVLEMLENEDRHRAPALIARLPAEIRAAVDALNLANKDLSQLQARLILLHGTDDAIIPYTESKALAAAVPRSELFLIDGLAHVDIRPFGLDRRAMWRAIHALLAQRDSPVE